MSRIWEPYWDGFVDILAQPDGSNMVPYLPGKFFFYSPMSSRYQFHHLWYANQLNPQNCELPQTDPPQTCINCCEDPHNYFHLIGASDIGGLAGDAHEDVNASFVFVETIEYSIQNHYCNQPSVNCTGDEIPNYIRMATSHELTHQFRVNLGTASGCSGDGEDLNNAWCSGSGQCVPNRTECDANGQEWCLMNGGSGNDITSLCQRSDGINRLDCRDLLAHPNCPETPDCSNGNSVRKNQDPE